MPPKARFSPGLCAFKGTVSCWQHWLTEWGPDSPGARRRSETSIGPPTHCVTVVITYLSSPLKQDSWQHLPREFHGEVCIVSAEQRLASVRALGQNCLFVRPTLVIAVFMRAKSLQSCPTHMDCRPPGSSVHWVLQARILDWVAMPFSRGSVWPRVRTCISYVSCTGRRVPY